MTSVPINWFDPEARLRLVARAGLSEYNRQLRDYREHAGTEVRNGYVIRQTSNTIWGRLYVVVGTGIACATIEEARRQADELPARKS